MYKKLGVAWCNRFCNLHSGLLVLRVMLGLFFVSHAIIKWQNVADNVLFFQSIGFASYWVHIVAAIELVGGIALILGMFTCIAGGLLAVVQLVAAYKIATFGTGQPWLSNFAFGYGMNLMFAAAALAIGWSGPGKYALFCGRCCMTCRKDQTCADCADCNTCGVCMPSKPAGPDA